VALVFVVSAVLSLCGCVDMRRSYYVYQYGMDDNNVTVPVGGVEHANQIEGKIADKLTGVTGIEASGNTASAGVSKGAVTGKLK
jgi:hypothetical protein